MRPHATFAATKRSAQGLPLRAAVAMAVSLMCVFGAAGVYAQGTAGPGFRIMADGTRGNCLACHALAGTPGVQSNFGPALDRVGSRYTADVLRQWVTDARQIKPDTLMPPFGTTQGTHLPNRTLSALTPDEITDVVAALQTLR